MQGDYVFMDGDWLLVPPSHEPNGAVHFCLNPELTVAHPPKWLLNRLLEVNGDRIHLRSLRSGGAVVQQFLVILLTPR